MRFDFSVRPLWLNSTTCWIPLGAGVEPKSLKAVGFLCVIWLIVIIVTGMMPYQGSVTRFVSTPEGDAMVTLNVNASDRDIRLELEKISATDISSELLSFASLIDEERQKWRTRLLSSIWLAIVPVAAVWLFIGTGLLVVRVVHGNRR